MVASFTKDSFNFLLGNTFVHTSEIGRAHV